MPLINRYFICLSYEDKPRPWDLGDEDETNAPAYFREVMRAMDRQIGPCGLTVYLTWKLDTLPSYGDDVVAVVMGDEWARYPAYASNVRATFKVYGTRPSLGGVPPSTPWALSGMLAVKFLRTCGYSVPGAARRLAAAAEHVVGRRALLPPVYPIPLGYGNQLALPNIPIEERSIDLFFAGSVTHGTYPWWKPQRWLRNPKTMSRAAMLERIERISADRPEWQLRVHTTATFTLNDVHYGTGDQGAILSAEAYSRALMDTRLCLAPRGTSAETFRYYEGLRYGCIVLAEPQPSRWFYDGAPVVEVRDWRCLPDIARDVLSDPKRMRSLHEAALVWWASKCSPEAVGRYIGERILRRVDQSCEASVVA